MKEHMRSGPFQTGLTSYTCNDRCIDVMTSARVHFVQTGLHASDDIIVLILPKVILGSWSHYWIGSLDSWQHMKDSQGQQSLFLCQEDTVMFLLSCCQIKLSYNCVSAKSLVRATFHCTFESRAICTLGKTLFSNDLGNFLPPFNSSLDWSSLNIPPNKLP